MAAVVGGYGVTWYFVAVLAKALRAWLAMAPSEAVLAASMAGFVFYVGVIVAAFAVRGTWRVCAILVLAVLAGYLLNISSVLAPV